MITLEQDKVFRAYEVMFHTDGWKLLMEDIRERKVDLRELVMATSSTDRTLAKAQGMDQVYNYLINLQSEMKRVEESLKELANE